MAAGWGQYEAVEILLEAGANVFAKDKRDKSGMSCHYFVFIFGLRYKIL